MTTKKDPCLELWAENIWKRKDWLWSCWLTYILSSVSLQSWKNLCSSQDAANICVRVSINSSRSAQASLIWSFHSAMVAASEWPAPMSWSQISLTAATRSWPIVSVSRANSLNRSRSICNHKAGVNVCKSTARITLSNQIKRQCKEIQYLVAMNKLFHYVKHFLLWNHDSISTGQNHLSSDRSVWCVVISLLTVTCS